MLNYHPVLDYLILLCVFPYRFNVMVDYHPADRRIFAWDNGHQVAYQITLSNAADDIVASLKKPIVPTTSP